MIEPGIGRIVHYRHEGAAPGTDPHAAIVIGLHSARCVNLACFTPEGTYYHRLEAILLQDDDAPPAEGAGYAEWMPFQKGQAVKTDAVATDLHPRIAALEEVLTAGGPIHSLFADLQKGVETKLAELETANAGKFTEVGDYLTKKFAELEGRMPPEIVPTAGMATIVTAGAGAPLPANAALGTTAQQPNPAPTAPVAEAAPAAAAIAVDAAGATPQPAAT